MSFYNNMITSSSTYIRFIKKMVYIESRYHVLQEGTTAAAAAPPPPLPPHSDLAPPELAVNRG